MCFAADIHVKTDPELGNENRLMHRLYTDVMKPEKKNQIDKKHK